MADYVKNNIPVGGNNDIPMDWDDEIQNDGKEYVVLPEGDYDFVVTNFQRGRFPGSAKMVPCNKAIVTLSVPIEVDGCQQVAETKVDLILNKMLEWKLSAFFRSIGRKKHGEKLNMDWNTVVGSVGRAHFKPRAWKDKDGNEHQSNDVARFLDGDGNGAAKAAKAATAPTTPTQTSFATNQWTNVEDDDEDLPF